MISQFLNLSTRTVNLAQIEYIDWDYLGETNDDGLIRIVVSSEEILLEPDSIDAKILADYVSGSKREQFAAIALHGLLVNGVHRLADPGNSPMVECLSERRFAEVAVWLADAMIAKLEAK